MASQAFVQHALKTFVVKTAGKQTTYLLDVRTLRDMGAKRWSRQRPADEARVEEIRSRIAEKKDVQGVISMAWHPKENLIVYDGQHRWCACCPMEEPSIRVLVEIMWDATEEEIVESFQSINRSVSVPELYTDPAVMAESVRPEIMDLVALLASKYKDFLSTSDKPNRPNFNRDRLTDELFAIWRDDFEKKVPFSSISRGLITLITEYHSDAYSAPREAVRRNAKMYEKCEKHGFWLFAQNGKINVEHLRATLKKYSL